MSRPAAEAVADRTRRLAEDWSTSCAAAYRVAAAALRSETIPLHAFEDGARAALRRECSRDALLQRFTGPAMPCAAAGYDAGEAWRLTCVPSIEDLAAAWATTSEYGAAVVRLDCTDEPLRAFEVGAFQAQRQGGGTGDGVSVGGFDADPPTVACMAAGFEYGRRYRTLGDLEHHATLAAFARAIEVAGGVIPGSLVCHSHDRIVYELREIFVAAARSTVLVPPEISAPAVAVFLRLPRTRIAGLSRDGSMLLGVRADLLAILHRAALLAADSQPQGANHG